ncbi:hypothetical protein BJ508DRAFT_327625 [Ascobolus immersus RN42]|uniref:F-box domain-containing protein n=1 Tax=Ascobolus immersus RN42 TaxID=1160509 RepID=A0A3N4I2B2_ASCIM|nr:hypothetical protein BJ508DRAFT_327625 [Ascobolus immersus RN42]
MSFVRLPLELRLTIADHLTWTDHKSFRQLNRSNYNFLTNSPATLTRFSLATEPIFRLAITGFANLRGVYHHLMNETCNKASDEAGLRLYEYCLAAEKVKENYDLNWKERLWLEFVYCNDAIVFMRGIFQEKVKFSGFPYNEDFTDFDVMLSLLIDRYRSALDVAGNADLNRFVLHRDIERMLVKCCGLYRVESGMSPELAGSKVRSLLRGWMRMEVEPIMEKLWTLRWTRRSDTEIVLPALHSCAMELLRSCENVWVLWMEFNDAKMQ